MWFLILSLISPVFQLVRTAPTPAYYFKTELKEPVAGTSSVSLQ